MIFLEWLLFFCVPAAIAIGVAKRQRTFKERGITIHVALVVSILILILAGAHLHFSFQLYAFIILLIISALCLVLLRSIGAIYIISSVIQQACLLLAGALLAQASGIIIAACASSIVFSLGHLIEPRHWRIKLPITFIWGIGSILIYSNLQQPMLNLAIHILGGTILIYYGVSYEELRKKE